MYFEVMLALMFLFISIFTCLLFVSGVSKLLDDSVWSTLGQKISKAHSRFTMLHLTLSER